MHFEDINTGVGGGCILKLHWCSRDTFAGYYKVLKNMKGGRAEILYLVILVTLFCDIIFA